MNDSTFNLEPIEGGLVMASVTIKEGQSVVVTAVPVDSFGSPTTNVSTDNGVDWTVSPSGIIVLNPVMSLNPLPWSTTISLPSPPVAGTVTITATTHATQHAATGTVTVTTNGPLSGIVLSFGTPTP